MISIDAVGDVASVRADVARALRQARANAPHSAALFAALGDDVNKRLVDCDGTVAVTIACTVSVFATHEPPPAASMVADDSWDGLDDLLDDAA